MTDEPERVADDDQLRSAFVGNLIRTHRRSRQTRSNPQEQRALVQFWDDAANIPTDVAECLASWEIVAERFALTRLLFDDARARSFIERTYGQRNASAFDRCEHPAMRSDYFRLSYIFANGGFYVDADDVCVCPDRLGALTDLTLNLQPLCYDARLQAMVPAELFLGTSDPPPGWVFYVNNNPLIAPPGRVSPIRNRLVVQ